MKDKTFYICLASVVLAGILSVGLLLGYTYNLKKHASVITVVMGERW